LKPAFPAFVLLLAGPRLLASCGPLFVVERSLNANVVVYELRRAPGGAVDAKQPVRGHWIMFGEDGRREELNALEKRLAYGIDVLETVPDGAVIAVRALRDRRIEVGTSGACPSATTLIQGRPALLRRVFVQLGSGGLIPSVSYVVLHGADRATGALVEERVDGAGRTEPANGR